MTVFNCLVFRRLSCLYSSQLTNFYTSFMFLQTVLIGLSFLRFIYCDLYLIPVLLLYMPLYVLVFFDVACCLCINLLYSLYLVKILFFVFVFYGLNLTFLTID